MGNRKVVTIEQIADDMGRAAKVVGVPPDQLTRADYRLAAPRYQDSDFHTFGGFAAIKSSFYPKQADFATILRLKDIKSNQRKLDIQQGSDEIFKEQLLEDLAKIPPIKIKTYSSKKGKTKIERYLNLVISDVHIGSDLKKEETGHDYGLVEEARAIGMATRTTIEYKLPYRNETALNVFLNGDMIQNNLHGISTADVTLQQVWRAQWLITNMICQFAQHFKEVNVYCTTGNHDRNPDTHKKLAISMKWASYATTIYYASKLATRLLPNVRWNIPKTPWTDASVLGWKMRATHGDTFMKISNPGSSFEMKPLEAKINRINASLKDSSEIKVFILGHHHIPMVTCIGNGSFLVLNGSTQQPDTFANSINILETENIQVLFETTREYAVGDFRFININESFEDKSLDKIIPPWPGLQN
jgi:predicted phosphodiesterase